MASHQLAIAKASFSAGLLRPDPTSLSREDIAHFHTLLNSAVQKCTPRNVQKCKQWILENIVQSSARFTALGKYLTALATSFTGSEKREPSIKRRRLHILYLVNDILYHTKYRVSDASICSKAQPILVDLFGSAASFKECPKHQQKLLDLLAIWDDKGYYSSEYVDKLREAVKNASEAGEYSQGESNPPNGDQTSTTKLAKSAPYVMPAMHGDPSTPWYDLPAGNLLQLIEPNSTKPINPDMIKPMQFVAGPANEELVRAVKALLDDVDTIYGTESQEEGKADWDIDELGQPIILDEIAGDVIDGEGYYGWSRGFCERMKQKKNGGLVPEHRDRTRSRSSSRGRKRRYSDSDSSGYRPTQRRRSYSPSRSRSRSASPRNGHSRPRSRSRSYSRSPSPPRRDSYPQNLPPKPQMPIPPPPPPFQQQQGFNPNFPPPPPPPSHNFSQWPPPPPPMPYQQQQQQPPHPQNWPIPPPPPGPPPPVYQQQGPGYQQPFTGNLSQAAPTGPGGWQQQQGGRGYNNNHNNGYNNNGWNNRGRGGGGYRGGNNYRGNRGWS